MKYEDAVRAVRGGLSVTDGNVTGKAIRIMVLFGTDYIVTDAKDRRPNIAVKQAEIVEDIPDPELAELARQEANAIIMNTMREHLTNVLLVCNSRGIKVPFVQDAQEFLRAYNNMEL